jgi:hypothetical protein
VRDSRVEISEASHTSPRTYVVTAIACNK